MDKKARTRNEKLLYIEGKLCGVVFCLLKDHLNLIHVTLCHLGLMTHAEKIPLMGGFLLLLFDGRKIGRKYSKFIADFNDTSTWKFHESSHRAISR